METRSFSRVAAGALADIDSQASDRANQRFMLCKPSSKWQESKNQTVEKIRAANGVPDDPFPVDPDLHIRNLRGPDGIGRRNVGRADDSANGNCLLLGVDLQILGPFN